MHAQAYVADKINFTACHLNNAPACFGAQSHIDDKTKEDKNLHEPGWMASRCAGGVLGRGSECSG